MTPRRDLRDDAAVLRVKLILVGRDVREHAHAVTDDRGRRVVAGRLDAKQQHPRQERQPTPSVALRSSGAPRTALPRPSSLRRDRVRRHVRHAAAAAGLAREFHTNEAAVGATISVLTFACAAAAPFVGPLADALVASV